MEHEQTDETLAENATRAVMKWAEECWDATRGVMDAYRVNTGDIEAPALVSWSELTERQQAHYLHHLGPRMDDLAMYAWHVQEDTTEPE